jgi:hypothetical protein
VFRGTDSTVFPALTPIGGVVLSVSLCDATSVAVSPSPVIAVGKSALSAVGLMPPCGVRARVYPDPAVLGAGLGENIVSIELLLRTRNRHDGTAQQLLYAGDQHIYMMWGVTPDGCTVSRAETPPSRMNLNPATRSALTPMS